MHRFFTRYNTPVATNAKSIRLVMQDHRSARGMVGVPTLNTEIFHQFVSFHNRNLVATGVPISQLTDQLSAQLKRVVVDKTGLAGNYNFQLSWSPDDAGTPSPDVAAPPDIFTALEEQLGLKLQPGKEEMDTFVIDHVEYPSEN